MNNSNFISLVPNNKTLASRVDVVTAYKSYQFELFLSFSLLSTMFHFMLCIVDIFAKDIVYYFILVFSDCLVSHIKQIIQLDSADVLFLANICWSAWRGFYQKFVIPKEEYDIKCKNMEKHKLRLRHRESWVQIPPIWDSDFSKFVFLNAFTFDIKLLHHHALLLWR